MSLQWTLVASFLYVEMAFLIILLLPILSPTTWQKIFQSRFIKFLASYASLYFNLIVGGLVLLFIDAIREFTKHKNQSGFDQNQINALLVKEFRAERNFYISGTALLIWFVLKRMVIFIQNSAHLIADNEAIKKQAESANRAANELLKTTKNDDIKDNSKLEKELMKKQDEIKELNNKLENVKLNLEAMKLKAENVTKEYDNLLGEFNRMTRKVEQMEYQNRNESKKDH